MERVATTSGTYTWVGTNSVGCDSTATLNLTINNAQFNSVSVSACDSYTWNGVTYTTSGLYSWTGTDVNGCDSTVFLTLTINNSTSSSTTAVHVMIIHGMELLTHHQEHILG